jgi:hypothetical protein
MIAKYEGVRATTARRCIDEQRLAALMYNSTIFALGYGELKDAVRTQRLTAFHHENMRVRLERLIVREDVR